MMRITDLTGIERKSLYVEEQNSLDWKGTSQEGGLEGSEME